MSDLSERTEFDAPSNIGMPAWARGARLTQEQLAAAERTRDYHVRKLESRAGASERSRDSAPRSEH
jgi:hypothetical protein